MSEVLLLSGSIPALVAALDLASVGIRVRIAKDVTPQTPQGPVTDPDGVIEALLTELAAPIAEGGRPTPEALPEFAAPAEVVLRGRDGSWKPQPKPAVWGIPGVPVSYESMGLFGTRAAMRAYLDRVKPVLTIGKEDNLAKLVSSRMGPSVLRSAVSPLVFERYGVSPDQVSVGYIAPGLNEALTRTGSLSGAALEYSARFVARETTVEPAVGWNALGALLLERLQLFGADRLEQPLEEVVYRDQEGTWNAKVAGSEESFSFDAVVIGDSLGSYPELGNRYSNLLPKARRVYAEIGIQPSGATEMLESSVETLEQAEDSQGITWSVRTCADESGMRMVRLHSGEFEGGKVEAAAEQLVSVLRELKLEPAGNATVLESMPLPIASREQRESVRLGVADAHEDHPDALLGGTDYFRGDLSLALTEVRDQAVRLRRRLTGIAD